MPGRYPSPTARAEELTLAVRVGTRSSTCEAWARDALALALPQQLLCREECAGLCPVCGVDLNDAEPGHAHEREPDPRWAKLSELRFD